MVKAMRPGKKLKVIFLNILKYFIIAKGDILNLGLESPQFFEDKYMVKSYENAA